jgi:hypothetical protein
MSLGFFHESLTAILDFIEQGKKAKTEKQKDTAAQLAYRGIGVHVNSFEVDEKSDEKAFISLTNFGMNYMHRLIDAGKALQKRNFTKAGLEIKKAIENGREVVKFAEEVVALTKKEEMDEI